MIRASSLNPAARVVVFGVAISCSVLSCGGADQAQAPEAESAVDEVVENAIEPLVGRRGDAAPPTQDDYAVQFEEGAPIPPDFPKDLPLPEGAELVGAYDSSASEAIALSVPGKPKELVDKLESRYADKGWTIMGAETNPRGDGLILATKDGRSIMTVIESGESGKSVVRTIAIEGEIPTE